MAMKDLKMIEIKIKKNVRVFSIECHTKEYCFDILNIFWNIYIFKILLKIL